MGQTMAEAGSKFTTWMPWREAIDLAGSLDALRQALAGGRILGRYAELRRWPSGVPYSGPGEFKPEWGASAREIDGRLVFTKEGRRFITVLGPGPLSPPPPPDEVFAIGVELERGPVERLFPAAAVSEQPGGYEGAGAWIAAEAKRMRGEIASDIKITAFARELERRMKEAAKTDKSIRPVKWRYIKNNLRNWGLWPITFSK